MDKNIYLTFDLDWACDCVIEDTLLLLEHENVPATIFVTHDTPLLKRMRKNPNIELGVHPNFIPYENDNPNNLDFLSYARKLLCFYKQLVPEATSLRSHGLTQNSRLLDLIKEFQYARESNLLLTLSSGINLKPFYHWNSLLRIPYFWEDDIHCVEISLGIYDGWDIEPFLYSNCIRIFDFHPIHLYLNTEHLERYEKSKPYWKTPSKLISYRNNSIPGDRDFLLNLIHTGKLKGYCFKRLDSIT